MFCDEKGVATRMRTSEALDHLWQNQVEVIRAFLDVRPSYEKLSEEVAYILEKRVRSANIEYATITQRAKTLDSFCEKVVRKGHKNPRNEITDVGGVRIVFLYLSDRPKLKAIIEEHFDVVEKVDKVDKDDTERFGYGALHYLVRLGKKASGARYDELKSFVCEIQVRTILQDAWAIVAHHLSYKQESDVPKELRRKLNALSGLFETADDQFNRLRDERAIYTEKVKKQITEQGPDFLKHNINLDNLIEYLNWRFPERKATSRESVANLLSQIAKYGYTRLAQIDVAVSRAYEAVKAYETKYPPTDVGTGEKTIFTPVGVVRVALKLTNEDYLPAKPGSDEWRAKIEEFRPLVKQ